MAENKIIDNKIIVDEDWKAQVQAEKEAAAAKAAAQPPAPEREDSAPENADPPQELPPASLASLIMHLAMQALHTLGQNRDPRTGEAEVHLPYARHMIDTLEMLEQKTKGNRTPEEISLLSRTLHELRTAYVMVERELAKSGS